MIKFSAVYALEKEIVFRIGIQAPLPEALEVLVKLGYDGVELHIPNPLDIDIESLKKNLQMFNIEVSAISTGLSYVKYGYSLSSDDENNRAKAIAYFKKYIEIAHLLDSKIVVVGTARGRCDVDCLAAKSRLENSLSTLGAYGRDMGVHLVLEPMNKNETDLINRVEEAVEVIKKIDNVYLLLDTYHILLEEGDVYGVLQRYGKYAKHIHVADTDRLPPGLGDIDWRKILEILHVIRYNGYISVEALMTPNYITALEIAINSLKAALQNYQSA